MIRSLLFCIIVAYTNAFSLRGFFPRLLGVKYEGEVMTYLREDFDCSICYKHLHVVGQKKTDQTYEVLSPNTGFNLDFNDNSGNYFNVAKDATANLGTQINTWRGGTIDWTYYSKIHVFQTNGAKDIKNCDGTSVPTSFGDWNATCVNDFNNGPVKLEDAAVLLEGGDKTPNTQFSAHVTTTTVTPCDPNPCNGGSCTADGESFSCDCAGTGFVGTNCDIDVDECAVNPCENGGTCTDGVNSYTCDCADGYDGPTCANNIDECANDTDNCHAQATCTNTEGGFSCSCNSGYTGDGVTCDEVVCGDNIVHPGEACDDGNTVDGDGCSATCEVEGGGGGDKSWGDVCSASGQCLDSSSCKCLISGNQNCRCRKVLFDITSPDGTFDISDLLKMIQILIGNERVGLGECSVNDDCDTNKCHTGSCRTHEEWNLFDAMDANGSGTFDISDLLQGIQILIGNVASTKYWRHV